MALWHVHVYFGCAGSHKLVSRRPLFRRSRFTSTPCSFLSYVHFAWQAWHFLRIAKTLAGAGQNERCSWRSFRVAGAVFGEFGRRLDRVEIAFCEIVFEFDLGHDDEFVWQTQDFGCLGLIFVAGAILCRPRSGWDRGKRSFLTFSMFMFRGGRNVLWKSNTCSCNPLVTLCASDRSRCGAARIVRSLAQTFRHFVRIGSLSLWRGANCEIAGASVSLLCAHRIALVVARSLGLWDRSCCGAVGILTLLVQPLGTLGLSDRSRCGTVLVSLIVKEILCRDLAKEVSYKELAQRSCTKSSFRDLVQRYCQEVSYRDLGKRALIKSLYRVLFKSLAKRPPLEILYGDIA